MRFKSFLKETANMHDVIVTVKDMFEPANLIVPTFKARVEYRIGTPGTDDYPIGDGHVHIKDLGEVEVIRVTTDEVIVLLDIDTEAAAQTIQRGTKIEKIPGYDASFDAYFYDQAVEDANLQEAATPHNLSSSMMTHKESKGFNISDRIEFTSEFTWRRALPKNSVITKIDGWFVAQADTPEMFGAAGKFKGGTGWIYSGYLKS